MSLKANCCPRCLTLKTNEPGHARTCSPTPLVRGLESQIKAMETELQWMADLYSHDKSVGELAMDAYEMSSTAKRVLSERVT